MSKKLTVLVMFFALPLMMFAKKVEISASPADAEIWLNGKKVGIGAIEIDIKKNDCVNIQIVREGYLTLIKEYCNQKGMPKIPNTDHLQLKNDESYEASSKSDIANVDVVLKPKKGDVSDNWKSAIRSITDYFDALEVSDSDVKYLRSAWVVDNFAGYVVRTRVIFRLTNESPQEFKLKIVTERASSNASSKHDERFDEWDRVLKKYNTLLEEVSSKIYAY
ncbi:hypothetical protein [Formosa sp. S-31]|uniref:hypothetical protein n=1 Tax=Formosa sp. S-31 TaxID=2790949 RepID=UPI003EBA27F2